MGIQPDTNHLILRIEQFRTCILADGLPTGQLLLLFHCFLLGDQIEWKLGRHMACTYFLSNRNHIVPHKTIMPG
ncbi:hypothetical protein D3C76_1656740 [compost metagenome]